MEEKTELKKLQKQYIKTIVITLTLLLSTFHAMTMLHENKHKEIYQNNDCQNIKIEYQYHNIQTQKAITTADYCRNPQYVNKKQQKLEKNHKKYYPFYISSIVLLQILIIPKKLNFT